MSTHAEMIEAQRRACEKASFYRSMGMPTYLLPLSLDDLAALLRERDELQQKLHALRLVCGTTDADKFTTSLDRAIQQRDQWREVAEWLVDHARELSGVYEWKRNTTQKNNGDMADLDAAIARFDRLKAQEAGK